MKHGLITFGKKPPQQPQPLPPPPPPMQPSSPTSPPAAVQIYGTHEQGGSVGGGDASVVSEALQGMDPRKLLSKETFENMMSSETPLLSDEITYAAYDNPVLASDGHIYNKTTFDQMITANANSSVTGKPLSHRYTALPNTLAQASKYVRELEGAMRAITEQRAKIKESDIKKAFGSTGSQQEEKTAEEAAKKIEEETKKKAEEEPAKEKLVAPKDYAAAMIQPIKKSFLGYARDLSEYKREEQQQTGINKYLIGSVARNTSYSDGQVLNSLNTSYWPLSDPRPIRRIILPVPFDPVMVSVNFEQYMTVMSRNPQAWGRVITSVFPNYATDKHLIHLIRASAVTDTPDTYFWLRDYQPITSKLSPRNVGANGLPIRENMQNSYSRMQAQRENMPTLTLIDRFLNGIRDYPSQGNKSIEDASRWATPSPYSLMEILAEKTYADIIPAQKKQQQQPPMSTFVSMPYITSIAPLGCLTGPRGANIDLSAPIARGKYSVTLRSTMWIANVSVPCCVVLYPLSVNTDDEVGLDAETSHAKSYADHGLTKYAMSYAYSYVNNANVGVVVDAVINKPTVPIRLVDWLCRMGCLSPTFATTTTYNDATSAREIQRGSLSVFVVGDFQTSVKTWLRAPLMNVSHSAHYVVDALNIATEIKWRASELRSLIYVLATNFNRAFGSRQNLNLYFWAGGMDLMSCGLLLDYTTNNPVSLVMQEWHPRVLLSTVKLIEDTEIVVSGSNNPFNVQGDDLGDQRPELSSAFKNGFKFPDFRTAAANFIYDARVNKDNFRLFGNSVSYRVWARFMLSKFMFELYVETLDALSEIDNYLSSRPGGDPSATIINEARYAVNSNKLQVLDELKRFIDSLMVGSGNNAALFDLKGGEKLILPSDVDVASTYNFLPQ